MVKQIIYSQVCPFCMSLNEIHLPADDFEKWQGGMAVVEAMPYLTPTNREFLISGICRDCQEIVFDGYR